MKKISVLLATIMALACAACVNKNTPEGVVEQFYKASKDNNIEEALTYTNIPEEERERIAESILDMGTIIFDYEVLNTTIEEGDSTAVVLTHLVSNNAFNPDTLDGELEVRCAKHDGKWLVELYY